MTIKNKILTIIDFIKFISEDVKECKSRYNRKLNIEMIERIRTSKCFPLPFKSLPKDKKWVREIAMEIVHRDNLETEKESKNPKRRMFVGTYIGEENLYCSINYHNIDYYPFTEI